MNNKDRTMPYIKIKYNINKDTFTIDSNLKSEAVKDLIATFLQTQIGAGVDKSPSIDRETYVIRIDLDMSDDTFNVSHNTGNKGLRDGMLLHVLKQL
jgi:hypothetical protein